MAKPLVWFMIMSRHTLLLTTYYSWLCNVINIKHYNDYQLLISTLHQKEFSWSVPNDDNRVFEGRNLREQFCEQNDIDYIYDAFPEEVSMLEVMIALAYRCESIMEDQPGNRNVAEWFWKMINNVHLDKYADDYSLVEYERLHLCDEISSILDRIINRTYERNGRGGLFPMKHDKKDQRKVELWYQMNRYLVENYYTFGTIGVN